VKLFNRRRNIHSLLGQLKSSGEYPPELLKARRSQYLKRAADLGMGAALSAKALAILKASLASTLELALQVALSVMVAGLAVTASVVYKDEILEFFSPNHGGITASEVAPLVVTPTPMPEETETLIPVETSTATDTFGFTPTPTATPTQAINNPENPAPSAPTPTNPGLHLGQTKTPKP